MIPYNQALRLNRECSNDIFYENRCNQLEKWLPDRNYKQKLVREQILKAIAISREKLLNNERNTQAEDWLVLNLTYHALLRDFQKVLNEAQILLMPNEEYKTVFGEKPPMTGWRKARTLKKYLVEQKLITTTPKNLKLLDVMVNVATSVSILKRHVSLSLMGINTIFEREL